MPNRQYHLQITEVDVGEYVLRPGDPARRSLIAARLDEARFRGIESRAHTWTGTLRGTPVCVTSTGIGGPLRRSRLKELSRRGAHTLIRVGICGSMQRDVRKGDLVGATAAVRDEGTSRQSLQLPWPTIAAAEIVRSMCNACVLDQPARRHWAFPRIRSTQRRTRTPCQSSTSCSRPGERGSGAG